MTYYSKSSVFAINFLYDFAFSFFTMPRLPSILVSAVMILIYVWNEYLFATTFMTGAENYTLAAGLYSLQATEMSGSWPVFAAASLVVSLPILIVFFAVQRHMTSGLTAGGVKG